MVMESQKKTDLRMHRWMSKSLEIVTHCYCPPNVTQYARMLEWQFQSIMNNRTDGSVTLSVCYSKDDHITSLTLKALDELPAVDGVFLNPIPLDEGHLFRRSVGRNIAATASSADIVYFTDVDYFFGAGFFVDIMASVETQSGLCCPNAVKISTTHEFGDRMLAEVAPGTIQEKWFTLKGIRKAIGGVQVIGGATARKYGYLDKTKWVKPVDPEMGFRSCRGDVRFRRKMIKALGDIEYFSTSSLYRVRHSVDGRDFTFSGEQLKGREAW